MPVGRSSSASPVVLAACDLGVQRSHAMGPECPVVRQPVVDLGERLGPQAVDAALCVLTGFDEAGFSQHPEVPGDPWSCDGESRSEFGDRRRVVAKDLEHGATVSVGDRVEHGIHCRPMYLHCYVPVKVHTPSLPGSRKSPASRCIGRASSSTPTRTYP